MSLRLFLSAFVATALLNVSAQAQEPAECTEITIADGGWTDNMAQNGFASVILNGLGYEVKLPQLAIGIMQEAMKGGDVDAFLGIWSPNGDAIIQPYLDDGSIINVGTNLTGAKYALAVPTYAYEGGLRSFQDIADWHDKLDGKIYALEAGNDSNQLLAQMQEDEVLGFERFSLVESSEQAMLAAVRRAVAKQEPIVFVGWSPHPMNQQIDMEYLGGGDEWFGENYGSAIVWTAMRPAYADQCPNVTRFFENLEFTPELLGNAMQRILDEDLTGAAVAEDALKADPALIEAWLDGVTTVDGKDGLAAVRAHLELD